MVALYHGLSEEDANEILVLLQENGIEAEKAKEMRQNELFWTISLSKKNLPKARELLFRHKLPKQKELGLTGVYKEKGLIPTPDEQKARFLLAIKGEIVNSLLKVPEIVDADVILNIPIKEEFTADAGGMAKRPTASVVVRVKPNSEGRESINESNIKQFVANAVEGLNPRDVTVIISYLPAQEGVIRSGEVISLGKVEEKAETTAAKPEYSSELFGLKISPDSMSRLKVYLLLFFIILVILSAILIVVIVQTGRIRKKAGHPGAALIKRPAVEGEVMEERQPENEDEILPPE